MNGRTRMKCLKWSVEPPQTPLVLFGSDSLNLWFGQDHIYCKKKCFPLSVFFDDNGRGQSPTWISDQLDWDQIESHTVAKATACGLHHFHPLKTFQWLGICHHGRAHSHQDKKYLIIKLMFLHNFVLIWSGSPLQGPTASSPSVGFSGSGFFL